MTYEDTDHFHPTLSQIKRELANHGVTYAEFDADMQRMPDDFRYRYDTGTLTGGDILRWLGH